MRTAITEAELPVPRALETNEIPGIVEQFRRSAELAKQAGFDGVELHAANGYLFEQFLLDGTNHRDDVYGGPIENRARFLFDTLDAVVSVWGPGRVAVRLSPSGTYGTMSDSNPHATFGYVAERLNPYDLAYLHVIEPRIRGIVEQETSDSDVSSKDIRRIYKGTTSPQVASRVRMPSRSLSTATRILLLSAGCSSPIPICRNGCVAVRRSINTIAQRFTVVTSAVIPTTSRILKMPWLE